MRRVVVFVVDTSASMWSTGVSYLDSAKAAVEHYLKLRSRDPSTFRQEMHFLISYAPGFTGIRCGWHNPAEFLTQLKALRAEHMSDGGEALRKALDLANLFRLASGVDNFGCGRKPWFNAHTTVVVLTDGGQLSSPTAGPLERLDLTALPFMPPASITSEPYRWDQRVFAVCLAMPRPYGSPRVAAAPCAAELQRLAELTGGGFYAPQSMKALLQSVESIVDRTSSLGVTLALECPTALAAPARGLAAINMQFVRLPVLPSGQQTPWWPFPEDFHALDPLRLHEAATTPGSGAFSRAAHPTLIFTPADKQLSVLSGFPLDKYELEPSPFTAYFLKTVKEGMCWPLGTRFTHPLRVYPRTGGAATTSPTNDGKLVGFLKQSSTRNAVNLYALPYNFPELFHLLDELMNKAKGVATPVWKTAFDAYVRNLPYYYLNPLRAALKHLNVHNVLPEHFDGNPPVQLLQHIKKLTTNARSEAEQFEEAVTAAAAAQAAASAEDTTELPGATQSLFSLPRVRLLVELDRLRAGFSGVSATAATPTRRDAYDDERRFAKPIAIMGDYHSQPTPPLRPVEEPIGKDLTLFGNPFFALHKVSNRLKTAEALVLDEAEDMVGASPLRGGRKKRSPKRQPSPVQKSPELHGSKGSPPEASKRKKPDEKTAAE